MTVVQKIDRRQAQRFQAAFDIRFSINSGPEILSNILNFTSRSLAIRSGASAKKGDRIAIYFGGLPVIEGEVVRAFPEGFAVMLNEASLAMMAHTHERPGHSSLVPDFTADAVTSPFIRPKAKIQTRALISSGAGFEPGYNRHFLSIITANPEALTNVSTIWISAEGTRWTANALRFERRNNRGIAVIALNDWQAHMGAAYGLKISVMNEALNEWSLEIAAADISDHLENLQAPQKYKLAVNA